VLFLGMLRYAERLLPTRGQRRTALVLGLFAVMPASWIVAFTGWGGKPRQYSFDFISGEMWTGGFLWGYLMTAIAVGLMPLVLLGVERWRAEGARGVPWLAAGGGLLVSWLQPWQGAELAVIVVAVEGLRALRARGAGDPSSLAPHTRGAADPSAPVAAPDRRARARPPAGLLAVLAALAVPLAYYFVLARVDPAWELAGEANRAGAMPAWRWPWWAMLLTVAPLAVPAALAYRAPARGWQEQAVRVWPLAVLAVYLLPAGTFPYHAFQGLAIPLAILAVQGTMMVWPAPRPLFVAGLLMVLTLPGIAHKLDVARTSVQAGGDPYFVFGGEQRALAFLARDRRPGGTLGPSYAGYLLPSATGRETWVGAYSWTPDWNERQRLANDLFEGRLTGAPARAFVVSTRARFLFADCRPLSDLTATLRPLLERVHRFGCATVYALRPRPEMARAAGPPDA